MKKTLLCLVLCLSLLGAMLAGCGSTQNGTAQTPATSNISNNSESKSNDEKDSGSKQYRVAYIARTQSDSFAAWLANEMKAAAEKYSDITLDVFDGRADDEKVNAAIENAITNGYDAIIVQPNNGEAQRPYVEKIVEAGIIAITTNARIDNIEGSSSVDADPYNQAAVNAALALEQVPENGRVVVLNGPSGNFHADERRKAWQAEFFDKRPDVTIIAEDIANWNKDEAMAFMEDWTTAYGQIDAIISMNDNMAAGALEIVQDYSKMLSYGVDGTAEACLLIQEGKMTSTCLQSAIDLAELNMQTVHKLLTGEATKIDVDIEEVLITKENAGDFVEMYKKRGLIKE
ncbi:MAG: sugar ABC transporter substrate-binding protein [Clostridiales bacterium]|jgi:inositol transport system substrate-binding protein|nr:sugar ABC transporter substrate-binding protein [Clostridiales bacterium]